MAILPKLKVAIGLLAATQVLAQQTAWGQCMYILGTPAATRLRLCSRSRLTKETHM